MSLRTPLALALSLALLAPAACDSDDGGGGDDTAVTDTTEADTTEADTTVADTSSEDTTVADTSVTDTSNEDVVPNDWGFPMRYPEEHTLPCDGGPFEEPDLEQLEMDWICTFEYGGDSGHIYVQATPTECVISLGGMPVFGQSAGWIALDGTVSALPSATYDWGGNHNNDSIDITYGDKSFRYYHSSLGIGWRACQPMDCLEVRDSAGAMIEDGCTMDRTLPIVCRSIAADGTWDDMTDTFDICWGDPNYEWD